MVSAAEEQGTGMMPSPEKDPWETAGPMEAGQGLGGSSIVSRRPVDHGPPALTRRGASVGGVLIIFLLCAVCVGLAFQSGAYTPRNWLPSLAGVAVLALVVSLAGPSVSSGRFQKILLGLFAAQTLWTAASIMWATSAANAWEEINRTLFYAIVGVLVFVAVRWSGRRGLKALVALLICVVTVVALVIVIRLAVSDQPSDFFVAGRLNSPIGYFNALASFLMIGFWLALGTANAAGDVADDAARAARGRTQFARAHLLRWAQPVCLALGVFFLEVALLPQSRGAFWTFFLTLPFFVIMSPNRFRALVDLVIVVLPVVLFWGRINGVYTALANRAPLDPALGTALRAIGYSVAIVVGAWVITWLAERRFAPLSGRLLKWVGIALIVVFLVGAAGGLIYAHVRTGGLGGYLDDRWEEVVSDRSPSGAGASRFAGLGLNGRMTQWKVAAEAFAEEPLLGIGAQNFELYWYQHRTVTFDVQQPHSQLLQLLCELGIPGLLLWVAFVALTLVYAARLRFRPLGRAAQAVIAAMMTAVISWFIHSSADWLWQMAATSLPAVMLLGGLVAAGNDDSRGPVAASQPRLGLVRVLAALMAAVVMVSAALPYLSIRYGDLAASSGSLEEVTARAHTAATLDPTAIEPLSIRAYAHQLAAEQAPEGSSERVAQLELQAAAWVEAIEREPGQWVCYFKAAEAFLAAHDAALTTDQGSAQESLEWARMYLEQAHRLNPLSDEVEALQKALQAKGAVADK
jgi:O-Antigen ligase